MNFFLVFEYVQTFGDVEVRFVIKLPVMSTRKYSPEDFGITQNTIDKFRYIQTHAEDEYSSKLLLLFSIFALSVWTLFDSFYLGAFTWVILSLNFAKDKKKKVACKNVGITDFHLNAILQYELRRNQEYQPEKSYLAEALDTVTNGEILRVLSEKDQHTEIRRNIEDIRSVHWRTFEKIVAKVYSADGYSVKLGPGANDKGIDIVAIRNNETIVIQCKKHKSPISLDPIRSFFAAMHSVGAGNGIIVSSSGFTEGALRLADSYSIQCLDSYDLLIKIRPELNNQKLIRQLRAYDNSVRISNMTATQRYYSKETARANR